MDSFSYHSKFKLCKMRVVICISAKLAFKGCVRYILASLFLGLNKSICQIKKNVFYFTWKPLFVHEKIKF